MDNFQDDNLKEVVLPNSVKSVLTSLFYKYGVDWVNELVKSSESLSQVEKHSRVGGLTTFLDLSAENSVNGFNSLRAPLSQLSKESLKMIGPAIFVGNIESIFEWNPQLLGAQEVEEVLNEWVMWRTEYLHNLKKMKKLESRRAAIREIEEVDFGGEELGCTVCGVVFYDNLKDHFGLKSSYCSRQCMEEADLVCIACDRVHKIYRPFAYWKLSGICSNECYELFKSDRKYVHAMRRRAELADINFDASVTRRKVFERSQGLCYICGVKTLWSSDLVFESSLATVDHVIPISKGGNHEWDNVRNCCLGCNIRKGAR